MREFFANVDGTQTMGDALSHWHNTREQAARPIDKQFEYNRFIQSWSYRYPDGTRAEMLVAWKSYRDTPIDKRI